MAEFWPNSLKEILGKNIFKSCSGKLVNKKTLFIIFDNFQMFFEAKKSMVWLKIHMPFNRQPEGTTCQHGDVCVCQTNEFLIELEYH